MQKFAEKYYSGSDLISIPSCSGGARSSSWKQQKYYCTEFNHYLQFPLGKKIKIVSKKDKDKPRKDKLQQSTID